MGTVSELLFKQPYNVLTDCFHVLDCLGIDPAMCLGEKEMQAPPLCRPQPTLVRQNHSYSSPSPSSSWTTRSQSQATRLAQASCACAVCHGQCPHYHARSHGRPHPRGALSHNDLPTLLRLPFPCSTKSTQICSPHSHTHNCSSGRPVGHRGSLPLPPSPRQPLMPVRAT